MIGVRDPLKVKWKLGRVHHIDCEYHSHFSSLPYRTFNIWVTAEGTSEPRLWGEVSFPAYRVTFIGYTRWAMGHLMKNIRTGAEPQPWTTEMPAAARPVGAPVLSTAPQGSPQLGRAVVPVRADYLNAGIQDKWKTVTMPPATQAAVVDLVIAWVDFQRCRDTPVREHTDAAMETVMALEARGLAFTQSHRRQLRTAVDMFHVLHLRLDSVPDMELVLCAFIVMHCKVSKSHARNGMKHRARPLYLIHRT